MHQDSCQHEVAVELGARRYRVHIGPRLLDRVGSLAAATIGPRPCLLVCDSAVASGYGRRVSESLTAAGVIVTPVTVPAGEASKSLPELGRLAGLAVRHGLGRDGAVITCGGGMVGDLGGFLGAVYMRGVPVIHLPTTLLAMVDASVGGKTAVNLAEGKNILGAFHQPALVVADPETLLTLTARDFAAGLAEAIKLGFALDRGYSEWISQAIAALLRRDQQPLTKLVETACRLKAQVVMADERDEGPRAALNFGHTVGHAVESVTGYTQYRHGEAVAIGMVAAARIGERSGLCQMVADPLQALLQRAGLPVRLPPVAAAELWAAMDADKKRRGGALRWVLPLTVGRVRIDAEVPETTVTSVLCELGALA